MFGILHAEVSGRVESGRVVSAKVLPGLWNPGLYAETCRRDREEFDAAQERAEKTAVAIIGTVRDLPDATYRWLADGTPA